MGKYLNWNLKIFHNQNQRHLVSEVLHILAIDSHQQVPGSQASAVGQGAGGYLDRRGVFRSVKQATFVI